MLKRAHRELARNAIYTEVIPTGEDNQAEIEALAQFSDSGSDSDSSSDDSGDDNDDDIDSEEDAELEAYIQKYEGSVKKSTKDDDNEKEGSDSEDEDEEKKDGSSDDEEEEGSDAEVGEEDTHFRCKICPKKILKNQTMVDVHLKGHEHKANLRLYKKALKEERTKEEIDRLKAKNQKKREKSLKKKEDRLSLKKQKLKEKKKRQWEKKMAAAAAAGSDSGSTEKKTEGPTKAQGGVKVKSSVATNGSSKPQQQASKSKPVAKKQKTAKA